jgi:hypothetical protein
MVVTLPSIDTFFAERTVFLREKAAGYYRYVGAWRRTARRKIELESKIRQLNADSSVHGIIVQRTPGDDDGRCGDVVISLVLSDAGCCRLAVAAREM